MKHSVKTVAEMLGENDSLGLVAFHGEAHCILPPRRMDAAGRAAAHRAVDALAAGGTTNIWAGLREGLQCVEAMSPGGEYDGVNTSVVLLTDGEPVVNPPRGLLPTVASHLQEHPLHGSLSTFGFGYSLDSALLANMADLGIGSYSFIPDASMVCVLFCCITNLTETRRWALSFVNFVSNTLAQIPTICRLLCSQPPVCHQQDVRVQRSVGLHREPCCARAAAAASATAQLHLRDEGACRIHRSLPACRADDAIGQCRHPDY